MQGWDPGVDTQSGQRGREVEEKTLPQLLNTSLALRLLKNLQMVVPISPFFRELSVNLPVGEQQARNHQCLEPGLLSNLMQRPWDGLQKGRVEPAPPTQ